MWGTRHDVTIYVHCLPNRLFSGSLTVRLATEMLGYCEYEYQGKTMFKRTIYGRT